MLAATVHDTPRPRPPAKVRRSSAAARPASSTPPPSYAAAFTFTPDGKLPLNSLLGSPMSATFQRLAWDADHQKPLPADHDKEWIEEKSREELAELLVKADDIIQERETGAFFFFQDNTYN